MNQLNETRLAEYQMLRDEISRHEQQIFSAFTFSLVGAASIISWGLSQKSWQVLAVTPLVLVPAGLLILSRVMMEMRIAAYIRVFFEDDGPDLNWETTLVKLTAKDKAPEGLLVAALFAPILLAGIGGLIAAWLLAQGAAYSTATLSVETAIVCVTIAVSAWMTGKSQRNTLHDKYVSEMRDEVLDEKDSAQP